MLPVFTGTVFYTLARGAARRGAVRERMLFNRLAEGEIILPPHDVQVVASKALADIRPLKAHVQAQLRDTELLPSRLLCAVFGSAPSVQDESFWYQTTYNSGIN